MIRHHPFALLLSAALLVLASAPIPAIAGEGAALDFRAWQELAIQEGGRRKPLATFSAELVLRITGRGAVKTAGGRVAPDDFLLSLATGARDWKQEPILLVAYRPLVERLGLDPGEKQFSFNALSSAPELGAIIREAARKRQANEPLERLEKEAESVGTRLALFGAAASGEALAFLPPPPGAGDRWLPPDAAETAYPGGKGAAANAAWADLKTAYLAGDAAAFTASAHALRAAARALRPEAYPSDAALERELFYNRLDPFDRAALGYGAAILFFAMARFGLARGATVPLGWLAALAGIGVHIAGLALRCLIAGRAPVTNMFESVIWVSLGTAVFAMLFFAGNGAGRKGAGLIWPLTAMPVALACLLLVARLPIAMPAAIDPLVPVLRSNFWLTTHVLTITLSYAAFALAMGFGHAILWRYLRSPGTADSDPQLHGALYRVMQLGVLLLAAGTILGGVWANYSWGRFWGWDPKETWALIALLGYLFLLHGKIIGWWNRFGMAVGSVVCFSGILMTWYGVNFILGAGLHSYGFGVGGEGYVLGFVLAEAAFLLAAWGRYRAARAARTPNMP